MQVSLSPYELIVRKTKQVRPGFLLRLSDQKGTCGYSDIFPWVEFGDPSFGEIPNLLKDNKLSPLLEKSLRFAKADLEARMENKSLSQSLSLSNHFSLVSIHQDSLRDLEQALSEGFDRIKIKVGRNKSEELEILKEMKPLISDRAKLRLDFNCHGDLDYLKELEGYADLIEFIEDPFGDPNAWSNSSLAFAFDQPPFSRENVEVEWQVIKPAKQDLKDVRANNAIFTSYLGHPIGQIHGMIEANRFGPQKHDYGFLTHQVYEPTAFSERLTLVGKEIQYETEQGIGFGDLLEKLDWSPIDV